MSATPALKGRIHNPTFVTFSKCCKFTFRDVQTVAVNDDSNPVPWHEKTIAVTYWVLFCLGFADHSNFDADMTIRA